MAKTKRANKSVKRTTTELNPMFFIPEGVDELVYTDDEASGIEDLSSQYEDVEEVDETTGAGGGSGGAGNSYHDAGTPVIKRVISQTIRRAKGGQMVVDVVLEVSDVDNATEYEFKVVKA